MCCFVGDDVDGVDVVEGVCPMDPVCRPLLAHKQSVILCSRSPRAATAADAAAAGHVSPRMWFLSLTYGLPGTAYGFLLFYSYILYCCTHSQRKYNVDILLCVDPCAHAHGEIRGRNAPDRGFREPLLQ